MIIDKVIHKLKNKHKILLLRRFMILLSYMRLHLTDSQVREAINCLGAKDFKGYFHYLKLSIEQTIKLRAFDSNADIKPIKKFNIAVCLSGDTRSFKHCLPQLQRFYSGYDVTYFCHGWLADFEDSHIRGLNNAYSCIEARPDFSDLERASIQAFGFKGFGQDLKVPFLSPNIFPMWYGVKRAFDSIESHGFQPTDFDLICRCRYDNFFLGKLSQLHELPKLNEIIIDPNYDGYGGYGDQFAIGQPKVMEKYFTLYDWLPSSFEQYAGDKRFFPEVIVKKYLVDDRNIDIKQIDFGLRLLRNDFIGLEGHKIPLRSHSVSQSRNQVVSEYIKNKFPDLYKDIN